MFTPHNVYQITAAQSQALDAQYQTQAVSINIFER